MAKLWVLSQVVIRFETNLEQPVSNIMTGQDRLVTVREGESKENIQTLLQKHRIEKFGCW